MIRIRPYDAAIDERWASATLEREIGGRTQSRRGELHDVLALPGLVAEVGNARVGLLTYELGPDGCELAVLAATRRSEGIGSALLDGLRGAVRGRARRAWVVTTNDNLDALRFYQRRGFTLSALRPGAVDGMRRSVKPSIGTIGAYGIPLRDELELELLLPDIH